MKKIMGFLIFGLVLLSATLAQAADAIATKNLNYRSGPGVNYTVLGSVAAGQPMSVSMCKGKWCLINFAGRSGWSSSNFLAFSTGREVYQRYQRPSPSYTIIICCTYYSSRYNRPSWQNRHYRGNYHPHQRPHHRPHSQNKPKMRAVAPLMILPTK